MTPLPSAPRPSRLLFLCTGNICRSPMAAALARRYAEATGREVEVRSASVMGLEGRPAAPHAVKVMEEIDLDLAGHRSQPMTPDLLRWADWILVMELGHAQAVRDMAPEVEDRVLLLGSFCGLLEIPDPLGGWASRYRRSRDQIRTCVERFVDRLRPREP
ncbi:MAG: low molecular weight protein arginine phosphatase [Deltaproteobacteria bacterium]|nr:low molecular weight protein arginine phosphatase [Deltaproteobacteria bacterium]